MKQQRPKDVVRTYYAKCAVAGDGHRDRLMRHALGAAVIAVGVAVQRVLSRLKQYLTVALEPDGRVQHADLVFPLQAQDVARARRLITQPLYEPPEHAGPKELASPRYRNSYRLEEILEREDQQYARARIAQAFSWRSSLVSSSGRVSQDLDLIDVKKGLQQFILSWLCPALDDVPKRLRAGVCQQAGQQLLSHLGLRDSRTAREVSFPSLEERDPERRQLTWRAALECVGSGLAAFPYRTARELQPDKYAPEDPRGDRLINIDPDWVAFVRSPKPWPLPLNFVRHDDVVIYERCWSEQPITRMGRHRRYRPKRRRWVWVSRKQRRPTQQHRRLYAALPLFEDVDAESPLGRIADDPAVAWWWHHLDDFHPLPAWAGRELTDADPVLLVPLDYDPERRAPKAQLADGQPTRRPSRFHSAFCGFGGRRVNWSLLVQRERRTGKRGAKPEWEIHFATSRKVTPALRPNVLGVHFGIEPIIWWALANAAGAILEEGRVAGNAILAESLRQKLRLEQDYQGNLRWVGERRFAADLKRRTAEVARAMVELAARNNANLAVEDIGWVDKRTGGPDANSRFTFWNFGKLRDQTSWQGLERQAPTASGELQADPVVTVTKVSDYLLRYTCPECGACRAARQSREQATTWREGETLQCRPCGYRGLVPDDVQARLVATVGAARLRQRMK